ncbi:hypothetical protein ACFC1B_07360 [Streptomyces xiamenensis]|uniref:hypothetical protein n=1 Tax=Streptomyces xiamenensis TaxID=408015 RepID=UPI0035DC702D
MTQRFAKASLVLGPTTGRSAALCRFTGHLGAEQSPTALAAIDEALEFAEQCEGIEDVGELLNLSKASDAWGYPPVPEMVRPQLSPASTVILSHVQNMLERLAPEELREVGIALSVSHAVVSVCLELVEEATAVAPELQVRTMAEFQDEKVLYEDRIGDAVDTLLLEAPSAWPALQRAALTLALVWEVADLIVYAAELSAVDALPIALLWQTSGVDHSCASASVPGTDVLVWARVDARPFEGRPLWGQAESLGLWGWTANWERADGTRVSYAAGHAGSVAVARWRAQWAIQKLLTDPHRAKSPLTNEPLIPRR